MIYVVHDFYSNFTSAVKGNDSYQQREIILGEVARVIVSDRAGVLELLRASGVKIPEKASDYQLVDATVKKINDERFRKGMAFLIAKNNDIAVGEKKSGVIPVIGDIVAGIGNVFQASAQKEVAAQNTRAIEDQNRTALLMKVLEVRGGTQPKSNTGKYILIGIVSLAVVVGAVMIFKNKK